VTDEVYAEFRDAVNMTPAELREWLDSDEAKEVGQKRAPGAESVGHDSGRKIVTLLGKKKIDLTDADEQHMRKVVGYVHRHSAQRPGGDVEHTRWRYSLMNWGHDPLKE
jgi:DNA topoisomerase VI subunit B